MSGEKNVVRVAEKLEGTTDRAAGASERVKGGNAGGDREVVGAAEPVIPPDPGGDIRPTDWPVGATPIPVLHVSEEHFLTAVYPDRRPVVLRGLDLGSCVSRWTPEYLTTSDDASTSVSVHVCPETRMNFTDKNFVYRTLPLGELVRRAARPQNRDHFLCDTERYYLRALGGDPRREPADIRQQFPALSADVRLPELCPSGTLFSSVLRISSAGVQLWTHYDVMDNALMQLAGSKRCVLYPPDDALSMYLRGDKSRVEDVVRPDLQRFPLFTSTRPHTALLRPGDTLFIPALWFHNMTALGFSAAVNMFWRHLSEELYHNRDVYGNKDPLPAATSLAALEKAIGQLSVLPGEYRDFYGRRMISLIQDKLLVQPAAADEATPTDAGNAKQ